MINAYSAIMVSSNTESLLDEMDFPALLSLAQLGPRIRSLALLTPGRGEACVNANLIIVSPLNTLHSASQPHHPLYKCLHLSTSEAQTQQRSEQEVNYVGN